MRTILVGECAPERLYQLSDPDAPAEAELEYKVAKVLSCIYFDFHCVVFGGGFRYDGRTYRPDLALVARDFSHWFIVEVELITHSFERHVLLQAKAFRYGDPEADCAQVLARELNISIDRAETLVEHVPRTVAIVANKQESQWEIALRSHDIQFLTVSWFRSDGGVEAIELGGNLEISLESLGFGLYSATDRSIRFPRTARLPAGPIQINDPQGGASLWTVTGADGFTWVTKNIGVPDIPNGSYVQLVRAAGGRILLRRSLSPRSGQRP